MKGRPLDRLELELSLLVLVILVAAVITGNSDRSGTGAP